MKTRTIEVIARKGAAAGTVVEAQQLLCEHCDGEVFVLYVVDGHSHMQCARCQETFCDGACDMTV